MALGLLARLFRRRAPPPRLPPPTPQERARLTHHRRTVERHLRQLDKTLKKMGCGPCAQAPPSRAGLQMEKRRDLLRAELAYVDDRLAQGDSA